MSDTSLRDRLIRLAHANPDVRQVALPLLKKWAEDPEAGTTGKYEEGKPADPTENMSEEDKKTWELNTLKHKDNFKKEAWRGKFYTSEHPFTVRPGSEPGTYTLNNGTPVPAGRIGEVLARGAEKSIRMNSYDDTAQYITVSVKEPSPKELENLLHLVELFGMGHAVYDTEGSKWLITSRLPRGSQPGAPVRLAANASRLKMDIRLKTGEVVPQGSTATVEFDPDNPALAILKVEGRDQPVKVSTVNLHSYLAGFNMRPSMSTLEKWSNDGVARSVAGQRVEPDGWDSRGTPSWLLVLGFV